MKKTITIILLLSAAFILLAVPGCAGVRTTTPHDTCTVTDMLGREVNVPCEVKRTVCIGAGALRLYSYVGDMSMLCGAESCEYGFLIAARPYQIVNAELFRSLPSVGSGGPQGSPNAESILAVHPDVIFSTYNSDASSADRLQAATGIPVVVLGYGVTEAFDKSITDSLAVIGKITKTEERASEVIGFIDSIADDLSKRTADIPDEGKKTVYLGCQSNYGTHGIGSSSAGYSLFDAVNANNILDKNGYKGYQGSLDLETLLELDPDVIILDAGGLGVLKGEYAEKSAAIGSLSAFRSGEVYVQLPYNAYYTNLETAYSDAYYIGKVLYPDRFSDVDMPMKFAQICSYLLGSDCYTEVIGSVACGYCRLDIPALAD